jgi:hypothetical protein
MTDALSTESLVLLAIVQCKSMATPEQVEDGALSLTNSENNTKYSGPKPNYANDEVFGSSWNELINSGYIKQCGSTDDSRPIFVSDKDINAVKQVCESDNITERQSFDRIVLDF